MALTVIQGDNKKPKPLTKQELGRRKIIRDTLTDLLKHVNGFLYRGVGPDGKDEVTAVILDDDTREQIIKKYENG